MRSHFLEKRPTTLQHHSSNLVPEWYTLVKKGMKCIEFMLLQSMEMGKEHLLSTQHIWKGLVKNRLKDSDCFLWLLERNSHPPVSDPVPSHSSSSVSQAKKYKKEYIKPYGQPECPNCTAIETPSTTVRRSVSTLCV
jgi:hypothetical protein